MYKCAFCSIPKKVIPVKKEWVDSQIESIKDLDATLVYLDDKTFGQAENYTLLPELYERIKEYNPDFKGFIIQTTALDFANKKRFSPEYLKNSHIQFVELGVETYNDDILTKLNKKHSHKKFVDAAMQNARDNNIKGYSLISSLGYRGMRGRKRSRILRLRQGRRIRILWTSWRTTRISFLMLMCIRWLFMRGRN